MGELLALRGINKGYPRGGRWLSLLADVSLHVDTGEIVAVAGSRGESKTTLLRSARCISGTRT